MEQIDGIGAVNVHDMSTIRADSGWLKAVNMPVYDERGLPADQILHGSVGIGETIQAERRNFEISCVRAFPAEAVRSVGIKGSSTLRCGHGKFLLSVLSSRLTLYCALFFQKARQSSKTRFCHAF